MLDSCQVKKARHIRWSTPIQASPPGFLLHEERHLHRHLDRFLLQLCRKRRGLTTRYFPDLSLVDLSTIATSVPFDWLRQPCISAQVQAWAETCSLLSNSLVWSKHRLAVVELISWIFCERRRNSLVWSKHRLAVVELISWIFCERRRGSEVGSSEIVSEPSWSGQSRPRCSFRDSILYLRFR